MKRLRRPVALSLNALALLSFALQPSAQGGNLQQDIEVKVSTASKEKVDFLRTAQPARFSQELPPTAEEFVFRLDLSRKLRKLEGFGAAFTESCTLHVDRLTPEKRREFVTKAFSKSEGAGLDNMRIPIGASDFSDGSRGMYTYNDTKDNRPDPEFKQFDTSRDEKTFTLIREALAVNPTLQLMMSSWSAPAWMKDTKRINGGRLLKAHYQDFANYLVKVLEEYRKRGLPVTSMTIQNEPYFEWEGVPSMGITFKEQSLFIRRHLAPALKRKGLKVDIWAHDHNFGQSDEVRDVLLANARTRGLLKGVAFHCYGGHRFEAVNPIRKYPELSLMNTECTGIDVPENDDQQSFHYWSEEQVVDAVRIGHSGSIAWNLCLDETHGPTNWGEGKTGCQNCRGMINIDFSNGEATPVFDFNPEYYAFAQLSKFISPKSRVLDMKGGNDDEVHGVAIENEDGKIVFAFQNKREIPLKLSVRGAADGRMIAYELPKMSVATFIWDRR